MAANTGKLAGKVIFITGASRGIGRAIALKAARDGANIVIAAKTKDAHPKLPGTIYSVAEEVEKAGGRCLPYAVDIRFEDQVQAAIDETIRTFGRLDILVNNASAISLTGTKATAMKTYDLMNGVNARGTFLCSKLCSPHLAKSGPGSHILNISPPLNMLSKWFQNHTAYTMAKYGMSMCVLGMAAELSHLGIAVNALWPKTAIYTAAMQMLGGGAAIASKCRKPEVVADAAYWVLSQPAAFSGHFLIDEAVLREHAGVVDMGPYSCKPGATLLLDYFLDDDAYQEDAGATLAGVTGTGRGTGTGAVERTFQDIQALLGEDAVKAVAASFSFELTGAEPGTWFLDLKAGAGSAGRLSAERLSEFDVRMSCSSDTLVRMFAGRLVPTAAVMAGELRLKGDVIKAMRLEALLLRRAPRAKA